jgi:hypothetical protein
MWTFTASILAASRLGLLRCLFHRWNFLKSDLNFYDLRLDEVAIIRGQDPTNGKLQGLVPPLYRADAPSHVAPRSLSRNPA